MQADQPLVPGACRLRAIVDGIGFARRLPSSKVLTAVTAALQADPMREK